MERKKTFPFKRRNKVERSLLNSFSHKYKELLEQQLRTSVTEMNAPSIIKEAMLYSLEAGGKRIRPLLLFATVNAFGEQAEKGLMTAAAVEMIHTYSLIHDDLPSMDNDDLRRGRPTNHKVFGDAFAILAGDALLTYGFQLITDSKNVDAETKIRLIRELAIAAGAEGMVGGQVADMNGENKVLTLEELEYIHNHKTGKLLAFCAVAGAILSGASDDIIEKFRAFALHLGLAFQIRDDILDLEGQEEKLGKPVGSDEHNHKSTYPALLTMDGAKHTLEKEIEAAKSLLKATSVNTQLLEELTDLVATRDH
ncbi:polyprenyl synthetase family protein [Robertmurraya yapensis]|uniref:Farnesyl diphosphate synthase n=1 Tax=Bacillus yapensis TaxID=2492960 RepID=A0A3S0RSE4_9BACI|nr:polyprenyl synthetase family protein [Bacillus yapensis]TKS97725.1 polyprenyl synthetase family protein [Bacillus yapensis]